MELPTFEKILLMLVATPGMIAPAATATNPASSAYSIKSCPRRSVQIPSFSTYFIQCFTLSFYPPSRLYRPIVIDRSVRS